MYLQGNLQMVFDALFYLGAIDPVLKLDWSAAMEELPNHFDEVSSLLQRVNSSQGNFQKLLSELAQVDESTLNYLAMEVAREFADFHSRDSLH